MLFPLGQVVATAGALEAFSKNFQGPQEFLERHENGDWGEIDKDDHETNQEALKIGSRVLSAYHLRNGTRIWIITEADRSSTTILLPEEY